MKKPDLERRWFDGCFQTVLWLGTATPSKKPAVAAKVQQKAKAFGAKAKANANGMLWSGSKPQSRILMRAVLMRAVPLAGANGAWQEVAN